uniref:Uncharacterized protein n=1 Tax=Syphacia muris TaxID=451379 RepID=A0A0N5B1H2_9BILA
MGRRSEIEPSLRLLLADKQLSCPRNVLFSLRISNDNFIADVLYEKIVGVCIDQSFSGCFPNANGILSGFV